MSPIKASCKRKISVECERLDTQEKKFKENGLHVDVDENITAKEQNSENDIIYVEDVLEKSMFIRNGFCNQNGTVLNFEVPICGVEVLGVTDIDDGDENIEGINSKERKIKLVNDVNKLINGDKKVNGLHIKPIQISNSGVKDLKKDLDSKCLSSKDSDSESSMEQYESDEDATLIGMESSGLKNDSSNKNPKSKGPNSKCRIEESESEEDAIVDVVSYTPDGSICGEDVCFVCKSDTEELVQCSIESCLRKYHKSCVDKFPTSKLKACPLHYCFPCYSKNPKNVLISKGPMYKCLKCPIAFHSKGECFIPGSMILIEDSVVCPKHFSPEEERKYLPVRNLNFCVNCGCNEDLVGCISCPFASHKKCHKGGTFVKDKLICERCESHATFQYGDIVWVKVYDFRWWPAKICDPEDVPLAMQKTTHFDGEFTVQFFLTDEYYWISTGRVYPFLYKRIGVEDNIKHNFKRFLTDKSFEEAVEIGLAAVKEQKLLQQSSELTNTKKPPPYKHIKSNRPVGDVQIYTVCDNDNTCGCQATDKNPCGYNTICLNRNMLQECHDGNCDSGENCQNRKFVKVQNAPCKPFFTQVRGWGLKATGDIKKGEFVIEYVGDLIDEEECERRIKQKQMTGDTNFYFCTLDSNRIIDAGPKGNFSRFMNHSCEPNCETQKWIVNGDPRIGLFAKEDIKEGTELTFDYQMDFSHYEKLKCNCGSGRCSGLIGKKPQNGYRTSIAKATSSDSKQKKITPHTIPEKSSKNKDLKETKKSNEKVETNVNTVNCIVRINGVKALCFKCKTGGKLIKCSLSNCDKYFHLRCVKEGGKVTFKSWKCPCHFCKNCGNESKYQCCECPNAYCPSHVDKKSNAKKFMCSKHR